MNHPINMANMAGINPMPGGPVGGVPMMNSASTAPRTESLESLYVQLNTCIYDYFIKRGQYDAARALLNDESFKLDTDADPKTSPDHVNGVDGDTSMTDSKDEKVKIPDEFPRPRVPVDSANSFLFEWFSLFWDIFSAQRKRGSYNPMVPQFVQQSTGLMRMRDQANQNFMRQPNMLIQSQMANMRRNGIQGMNLQKAAMQNNTAMNPQQMSQMQQLHQSKMQREHSEMDMNGHHAQSPSSADNAPSPSKRPRLDGSQPPGQQMVPNGRAQGQMPGQLNLMQNGINARGMNTTQFQAFQQQAGQTAAQQQKSMQVYAQNLLLHHPSSAVNNQGMPNGLMNNGFMPNQNDMMPQLSDGQIPMLNGQFINTDMAGMPRAGMPGPNQGGNHALQDYQMQLMLLEQQNKRRLMMARQEQNNMHPDGQPIAGQPVLPPGTSPQGSRTGASPNPSEQMKRGTPKISQTGLPASPSAVDLQGRGSPAAMNFAPGQMTPDMNNAFYNMKPDGMVGGPNGMRPPTSNQGPFNPQMNQAMQQGPNARMQGGAWPTGPQGQQGPPMVAQQSPATQAAPTPQERNAMPPPSAPPAGNKPPSPQQGAAPPTPQQANKPAPKGKKDTEKNRKRPNKKNAAAANANTAATPSSEAEPPPTPTPSTPITPQHPNSFNKNGINATTTAQQQQPTSAPAPSIVQQPDPNVGNFNELGIPDTSTFGLDFSLESQDFALEGFDFDTFLNTDADATGFGFDPSNLTYPDGVETGTDGS